MHYVSRFLFATETDLNQSGGSLPGANASPLHLRKVKWNAKIAGNDSVVIVGKLYDNGTKHVPISFQRDTTVAIGFES